MELVLSIVIVLTAVAGLGLGLTLTGRAPRTSCDGLACDPETRCAGCPRRKTTPEARHG